MNLENIMSSDLVIASIHDNIKTLSTLMKKYDIGFLPMALNKKILGVITDRDIVLALSNGADLKATMESYMTKKIVTISLYSTCDEALKLMAQHKIKRLLVTKQKKVVGVLSFSDILHANIDSDLVLDSFKEIMTIYRNIHSFEPSIDEFYL